VGTTCEPDQRYQRDWVDLEFPQAAEAAMSKVIPAFFLMLLAFAFPAVAATELHFKFSKEQRNAYLHTPDHFDETKKYPAVIVMHSTGETGNRMEAITGFDVLGNQEGFITVFPDGTSALPRKVMTWNAVTCCGKGKIREVDDVRFIDQLIMTLIDEHHVDPKRVYLVGQGNGGMMAYRYACKHPEKLAAMAVSGGQAAYRDCEKTERAVPTLQINGTKDICMPYEGGEKCGACFDGIVSLGVEPFSCLSAKDNMKIWARQGECTLDPVPGPAQGAVSCQSWKNCRGGSAINLCTITDGGHNWAGSDANVPATCKPNIHTNQCRVWRRVVGSVTKDIIATDFMWGFLKAHKLP
jgi:polyhydroxybutyrate depolymerase